MPLVIEAIKELVSDKNFAEEIEKRIGVKLDNSAIDDNRVFLFFHLKKMS